MAGAWDFLPPFSFWAAIISCLLRSASSSAFFFASIHGGSLGLLTTLLLLGSHHLLPLAFSIFKCLLLCKSFSFLLLSLLLAKLLLFSSLLLSKFFLLLNSNLLPLGLFLLQPLEFLLFLCSFIPPLVDVLLQLIIQLALLGFVFGRSHDV